MAVVHGIFAIAWALAARQPAPPRAEVAWTSQDAGVFLGASEGRAVFARTDPSRQVTEIYAVLPADGSTAWSFETYGQPDGRYESVTTREIRAAGADWLFTAQFRPADSSQPTRYGHVFLRSDSGCVVTLVEAENWWPPVASSGGAFFLHRPRQWDGRVRILIVTRDGRTEWDVGDRFEARPGGRISPSRIPQLHPTTSGGVVLDFQESGLAGINSQGRVVWVAQAQGCRTLAISPQWVWRLTPQEELEVIDTESGRGRTGRSLGVDTRRRALAVVGFVPDRREELMVLNASLEGAPAYWVLTSGARRLPEIQPGAGQATLIGPYLCTWDLAQRQRAWADVRSGRVFWSEERELGPPDGGRPTTHPVAIGENGEILWISARDGVPVLHRRTPRARETERIPLANAGAAAVGLWRTTVIAAGEDGTITAVPAPEKPEDVAPAWTVSIEGFVRRRFLEGEGPIAADEVGSALLLRRGTAAVLIRFVVPENANE
jgi:hypothetical protein